MVVSCETFHDTIPASLRRSEGVDRFITHNQAGTHVATTRQSLIGSGYATRSLAQACRIRIMRSYISPRELVADQVSRIQIDILHSYRSSPLTSSKHQEIRSNIISAESRTKIDAAI